MQHSRHAFTLVELSIVLVILGLLIGGVLTGQSLIRAAELRSVSTQYSRYVTAVQTFRDKYFALPGDMNNAQSYWGVAHATPATCKTTASTTALTCNGDGNGQVSYLATSSNESFRFWQHLANAGLIEGSYDGITHGSNDFSATVANAPVGRISASLWYAAYVGTQTGVAYYLNGDYGNHMAFGGVYANGWPGTPVLKAEEAYNIDTKMDDGKPGTGLVGSAATGYPNNCNEATAATDTGTNYRLGGTSVACAVVFRNAF